MVNYVKKKIKQAIKHLKKYVKREIGILICQEKISFLENEFKKNQEYILILEKRVRESEKLLEQIKREKLKEYKILQYRIYKYMDSEKYPVALRDWYYEKTGEVLNLEHPRTYNEIIQWTKLYDMSDEKVKLVDKYLVRKWVENKIGKKYLIPLLEVWDNAEDIQFEFLPQKFVLKCNHGSGYNIIVTDKSKIDEVAVRKKIKDWLNEDFAFKNGFELHYSRIVPKIIAEEYLENNNENLNDYKVFCFNGKAQYIMYISNRKQKIKKQIYDLEWNLQSFINSKEKNEEKVEKPQNLEELISCAEKLAEDFLQVRVDFYQLNNGEWKFGEMTFTPASGIMLWEPREYDKILGEMIEFDKMPK